MSVVMMMLETGIYASFEKLTTYLVPCVGPPRGRKGKRKGHKNGMP